ncbi:MAG: hypothetical protein V4496_03315 [Pseudomonadota bacterium]
MRNKKNKKSNNVSSNNGVSSNVVVPFNSLNSSPVSSRANSSDNLLAQIESGRSSSQSSTTPVLLSAPGEYVERYEEIDKQYRSLESLMAFSEVAVAAVGPLFIAINAIQVLIYLSAQKNESPWIGNTVMQCVTSLLPVIIVNIVDNIILFERRKKMQELFKWSQDVKSRSEHDLMYYRNIQLIRSAVTALFPDDSVLGALDSYLYEDFLKEYQSGHFTQEHIVQFEALLENEADFLDSTPYRNLWTALFALLTLANALVVYLGDSFISSKKISAVTTLIAASILIAIIIASYRLEYSSRFLQTTNLKKLNDATKKIYETEQKAYAMLQNIITHFTAIEAAQVIQRFNEDTQKQFALPVTQSGPLSSAIHEHALPGLEFKFYDQACDLYSAVAAYLDEDVNDLRDRIADHLVAQEKRYRKIIELLPYKFSEWISGIRAGNYQVDITLIMAALNRAIVAIDSQGNIKNENETNRYRETSPIFVCWHEIEDYYSALVRDFTLSGKEIWSRLQTPAPITHETVGSFKARGLFFKQNALAKSYETPWQSFTDSFNQLESRLIVNRSNIIELSTENERHLNTLLSAIPVNQVLMENELYKLKQALEAIASSISVDGASLETTISEAIFKVKNNIDKLLLIKEVYNQGKKAVIQTQRLSN